MYALSFDAFFFLREFSFLTRGRWPVELTEDVRLLTPMRSSIESVLTWSSVLLHESRSLEVLPFLLLEVSKDLLLPGLLASSNPDSRSASFLLRAVSRCFSHLRPRFFADFSDLA